MIIVEGPDGSGKTTLANWIVKETNREYRRPPKSALTSKGGPSKKLSAWWWDELGRPEAERKEGVYDRCMVISEPIYMAVARPQPMFQPTDMVRMTQRFLKEQPLIVFCNPGWAAVQENFLKKDRDQLKGVTMKDQAKIYWLYMIARDTYDTMLRAMGKGGRVITYDWENTDVVFPAIMEFINAEAQPKPQAVY